MNLFPGIASKAILVICIVFIALGIYTVITMPEYEEGGWFGVIMGLIILGVLWYKSTHRRPGQ